MSTYIVLVLMNIYCFIIEYSERSQYSDNDLGNDSVPSGLVMICSFSFNKLIILIFFFFLRVRKPCCPCPLCSERKNIALSIRQVFPRDSWVKFFFDVFGF